MCITSYSCEFNERSSVDLLLLSYKLPTVGMFLLHVTGTLFCSGQFAFNL